MRRLPGSTDRILGHRSGDLRRGNHLEPQSGPGAPEEVRVHRTGTPAAIRRGAGAPGLSQGPCAWRRCDAGGDRVPKEAEIQWEATDPALLLPGARESKRPVTLRSASPQP